LVSKETLGDQAAGDRNDGCGLSLRLIVDAMGWDGSYVRNTKPSKGEVLVMIVKARPLVAEAFAPFGQVLMGSGSDPERHPFAARVENLRADAKANLTFMRVAPAAVPIRIAEMERHPHSHQLFVPLDGTRYLVAVCPGADDGGPDLSRLRVFTAEGSQAVNYNAGVWHAPRTVLGGPGEFIMMRWDDGTAADTDLRAVEAEIEVDLGL
jgi:ureidoglycolate lyase